jgi:hypothetical protein
VPTPAATATLTAATHGHDPVGLAWLALTVTALAAGYLLTCWLWPFGNCRRCHGTGKSRAPLGRAFRHCPRCDGSGYRIRAGRHVITQLRDTHRAGTRPVDRKERNR